MASILSSILGSVSKRVMDTAIEEYRSVRDVEEIRNLRTTVDMIKGVLQDAERKQVESHAIREWLKSLKQVLYDAEDVFDEIATYEALERDAEDGTSRLPKVRKLNIFGVDISSSSRAIEHRVKDINKKFDDISNNKVMLGLHVSDETSSPVVRPIRRPPPDTSSLLPKGAHIIGRDDEMRKLEELLLEYSAEGTVATTSDNYKNVRVISVVGICGVGKTTLVQHAYNSPAVAEYFHPRMWVCASNDFDVERITGEIMEATEFNSKKTRDKSVDPPNWYVVQKSLQGKLAGKRFLLVLDNVWEEDPSKWDSLCTPLMYGGKGSKIIVTTQSQKVASITKGTPIFLKDLSNKDLWSIFQTYAFDGHDPDKFTQLVGVGRQIVDEMKGSLLAAKTTGRLLNSNLDVRHWTNIVKSKTWELPDSKNSILPILKLSYDYLPGHLKQCFAYCSLFPEDYLFHKSELVQLWMAHQFIQNREGFFNVESEGREYIDDLVCMSLFEISAYGDTYVMHDLIHNLAELVSKGDCLRLEDKQHNGTISETVRHVSIASDKFDLAKIEQLCNKCENMRTLLFLRGCKFQLNPHLDIIFMKLQRLRVLRLSSCGIKELPASIGTLKHLRFLDLSDNLISKLPESLCNLRNLQVLNLDGCYGIRALPRNMSALINLRHLIVDEEWSFLVSGIEGLGKLTALHELDGFDCARQPMKELADMGMLRRLRIRSLEKVKSREEAAGSRLDKKEHLDELRLEWSGGRDNHLINPGLEEEVLDSLQPPHSSIRRLSIYNYGGSRSPSWMEEDQSCVLSCFLRTLELFGCTNWEVLPPLGQLLCLDSLTISGMRRVRRIGPAFMGCCRQVPHGGFPSLQVLKFEYMEEWEQWEVPLGTDDDGDEDDQVLSEVPPLPRHHHHRRPLFLARLRELTIQYCPKLRQLPPLPPTLTQLEIVNVGLTHLPEWWLPPSSSLLPCCSSSPSLSSLKISGCSELTSLADRLLRHPLPNLRNLTIVGCFSRPPPPTLRRSLPSSLQRLTIDNNDQLDDETLSAWLRGLTSLRSLSIRRCPALGGVHCLVSLEELIQGPCFSRPPPPPTLRRSLPSSLQELTIGNNDQLDDETLSAWLRGLTSLGGLYISECPAVTSLPGAEVLSHLTALVSLHIRRLKALSSFGGGVHCLVSLESLSIEDCPELLDIITTAAADSSGPSSSSSALPSPARSSVGTSSTTRIRTLEIRGSSMQQIKTWLLQCPFLQELHICFCPQLTGFGGNHNDGGDDVGGDVLEAALLNLSGTLQRLYLSSCENLRSLPPRLRCLSSLQFLSIDDCPQIRSLPMAGPPESLRGMQIWGCPAFAEWCTCFRSLISTCFPDLDII